jgi:small subunit ribosomal protein S17
MERARRKTKTGVVVGDKMSKTRIIEVISTFRHKLYGKVMHRSKKFYAHDEKNESRIGDRVSIIETRPISKLKRWYVVEIVKKAES